MNVLITGVAGDIGNGIGRILRDSEFAENIIGCDIHDQHAGRFVFNACELVPRAVDEGYLNALVNLTKKHNVNVIVPTSEPELRFLLKQGISKELDGIPLVMANIEALRIGFDKLETADFLRNHNLPFPWTETVAENDPRKLPCIMKSRFGAGGQDVRIVDNIHTVPPLRELFADYIWQELVGTSEDEYTCGVYRSNRGDTRTIVFRRRLSAGTTSYGVVVVNPLIDQICIDIANALELVGSINVQLRLTSRGPVVFEINPRFSSTVVFRHKLGFEDVIWSISERLNDVLPVYNNKTVPGQKIFRKFEEVIQ